MRVGPLGEEVNVADNEQELVDAFNDITPRFGVAYDVFGNGRTAVKFNMGHYLDAATNDSAYTRNNPANRTVSTYSRNWTDNDGDKVPVKLRLLDEQIFAHDGRMDFVDNAIDTSSGTIRARAVFANPKGDDRTTVTVVHEKHGTSGDLRSPLQSAPDRRSRAPCARFRRFLTARRFNASAARLAPAASPAATACAERPSHRHRLP